MVLRFAAEVQDRQEEDVFVIGKKDSRVFRTRMMCFENGSFYSSYGFCVFTSVNINVVIYLPKSRLYMYMCVCLYIYYIYVHTYVQI